MSFNKLNEMLGQCTCGGLLFETLPIGIVFQDASGVITLANPAAERILGLRLDELKGITSMDPRWHAIREDGSPLPGDQHPAMVALKTQVPVHNAVMGLCDSKALETIWLNVHATPIWSAGKQKELCGVYTAFEDITERKHQEETIRNLNSQLRLGLRQSEADLIKTKVDAEKALDRFQTIFEQAPLGIAVIDSLNGQIYEANPRFAEITGRSPEELASIDWMSITHPDDIKPDLDNMASFNAGEIDGFQMDKRYLRPDGEPRWIRMTIASIAVEPGHRRRHLCMVDDITERLKLDRKLAAQQVVQHHERRHRYALESLKAGEWELNLRTLEASRSLLHDQIFGFKTLLPNWTYEMFLDHVLDEDRAEVDRRFKQATEQGSTWDFECRIRRVDSEIRWIRACGQQQLSEEGDPVLIGVVTDITERKEAEIALRSSAETLRQTLQRLELATEAAEIGIWVWTFEDGRLEWDHRMRNFYEWPENRSHEEIGYADWSSRLHPEDKERTEAAFLEAFDSEAALVVDFRLLLPSGRIRYIQASTVIDRDHSGNPLRMVGINRDMTEEKLAQAALYEAKTFYQGIFNGSYDAIVLADIRSSRCVEVNPAAIRLYGYSREEFLQLSLEDISAEPELTQAAINKRDSHIALRWHRRRDGTCFPVEVLASYVEILGREFVIGVIHDLSERLEAEKAINRRQNMLARTESIAHIGSWEWDKSTDQVAWSDELFRIFQLSPNDGAPSFAEHGKMYLPADREKLGQLLETTSLLGVPFEVELQLTRRDGEVRTCLARGYPEGDTLPTNHLFGTFQDITEHKRSEAQLRLAANVFYNSLEGIVITDATNHIVDVNPSFTRITGFSKAEVLGKDPKMLASGRHSADFYAAMWNTLDLAGVWQGEVWNRRKGGEVYAEMLSIASVRDESGAIQNYISVFSDISTQKAHEAELDRIAHYDTLTGVPNRRLLYDRLRQGIAQTHRSARPLAVCYLDLDGFKPINDQYGHEIGDQLLIKITEALKGVLRANDTIARLGGDEFVLIFSELSRLEDLQVLLNRVLDVTNNPIRINDLILQVSASIGATVCPPDIADTDLLLRHADQAMYRAKELGKNCFRLYDHEQDLLLLNHAQNLLRLKEALAKHEFVLHYQPQVNFFTREVIGVEALIRWQHPQQGLMTPSSFLSYLDGSELEMLVGDWVIATALDQIDVWKQMGLKLRVSVNISAQQLLDSGFCQRMSRQLNSHPGVQPSELELEILESAALSDVKQAGRAITECRAIGVSFALDDFGTGYSSLTYFRALPVDMLKIDQSFVRDMLDDANDREIVESVVRLAKAFNRLVIAEGVETVAHSEMLKAMGCQCGQGFGIARPMPPEEIPAWVKAWTQDGH